jgi:ribonuclease VapC
MFVDASAIVAILLGEPGAEELEKRLAAADGPLFVSPIVRFEAAAAVARALRGGAPRPSAATVAAARDVVDAFAAEIAAEDVPITAEIGAAAIQAAARWGKLVGHPADLNFGDCFAYACAATRGVALLYKGDDFARTDLG